MAAGSKARPMIAAIRCAIYTRKSTDEGLDSDFNTLDAQRESAEAYIVSQRHEGWIALPQKYDDGGFTGANMERPALKRLLDDVRSGLVTCVVVYKVDRLTRSLLDFSKIMEVLDKHGATFVSVTQQFNTTASLGRLTLNILLSFAQFEREMIAERTRDKMSAARRKGKWVGGNPVLGYDVHPDGGALVVNAEEAARVRAIFAMYLCVFADRGASLGDAIAVVLVPEAVSRVHPGRVHNGAPVQPHGQRVSCHPEVVHGTSDGFALAEAALPERLQSKQRLVQHAAQLGWVGEHGVEPVGRDRSRRAVLKRALERYDHPAAEECRRGVLALRRMVSREDQARIRHELEGVLKLVLGHQHVAASDGLKDRSADKIGGREVRADVGRGVGV